MGGTGVRTVHTSSAPTTYRPQLPAGFAALWGAVALDLIGFGIVLPILPVYAERFNAGPATATMIVAAFSAAQFVAAPLWGRASDRWGRRPVLIAALIGSTIGSLLTGFADVLWLLFAARILDGASGTSYAVAQAAVSDIADPKSRPRLLGLLGAAFGLGFVVGPIIGSVAALGSDRLPFFIAAGLSGATALLAYRSVPETNPDHGSRVQPSFSQQLRDSKASGVLALVLVSLVTMSAFSALEGTMGLMLERRFDLVNSSIYGTFALVGIGMVVMQTRVVGPTVDRLGERSAVVSGLVLEVVGMVLIAGGFGWFGVTAGLTLLVVGQGLISPTLPSMLVGRAEEARGSALGLQQSAGALGRIIGPVGGGLLFEHAGIGWPYGVAAGVLAIAALLATKA